MAACPVLTLTKMQTRRLCVCSLLSAFSLTCLTKFLIRDGGLDFLSLLQSHQRTNKFQNEAIAIIGAGGNVGSYLMLHLSNHGLDVHGFDRQARLPNMSISLKSSTEMNSEFLSVFRTVVFLGGCTGRQSCAALGDEKKIYEENVQNVLDIAHRMNSGQHLIVASTSAIAEGSGYRAFHETDPPETNRFDAYTKSMRDREIEMSRISSPSAPQISVLRFGTVVGVSPGQRTDLMIHSMFKAAYTSGIIRVVHGESVRSFLWLPDLARAMSACILGFSASSSRLAIFHLSSFTASAMKVATNIASLTGARIYAVDHDGHDLPGFSLNVDKFKRLYDFEFAGNLSVAIHDIDVHIPDSISAKGIHTEKPLNIGHGQDSIPCPVCGSENLQEVLDLHEQPLANDFMPSKDEAVRSPTYPLKLVRCRECNHMHLSNIINRSSLFSSYLYRSGTSKTLLEYFRWLADKVINETGSLPNGNVLEIACNDGSQLDQFKARGWRTFGVDPAANLIPLAEKKGHIVKIGFWSSSLNFRELPSPESLHAIVAQNVLAHVPNPVDFLRSCAHVMGSSTRLYIQTSQCQMHQLGQFDTAYHEHISFFTGHSFLEAARLAGLHVANFELTPIHGTSCLVTMQLASASQSRRSASFQQRLDSEQAQGITTDFFYVKYRIRAHHIKRWITTQLLRLTQEGYQTGAYGAAAKGMVLLHFLLLRSNGRIKLDFVLDDSTLKQNRFCPGTSIPVWPTSRLRTVDRTRPLVLLILAWNFLEEICQNIRNELVGWHEILIVVPFPKPRVVRLKMKSTYAMTLLEMPLFPTSIPNPLRTNILRRKVLLVSHFNNEEFLLPSWIRHHAPMFDHAVLIDFKSNDSSRQIFIREAPESWKIVESTTGAIFDAIETDNQVMYWEKVYPTDWSIALTTTEFLMHPHFRNSLLDIQVPDKGLIHKFRTLNIVGEDKHPLLKLKSLTEQRTVYCANNVDTTGFFAHFRYDRYLHVNTQSTHKYGAGRHKYLDNTRGDVGRAIIPSLHCTGFIMKFTWSPWPEILLRFMQGPCL